MPGFLATCEALLAYKSIHQKDFEKVNTQAMENVRFFVDKVKGRIAPY